MTIVVLLILAGITGTKADTALKFIEPNYGEYNEAKDGYNIPDDSYVKNSTGKGNYDTDSIAVTGSNNNYQQKHIFDMAGNCWEWTMEAYDTNIRVDRGGYYYYSAISRPASIRSEYGYPNESHAIISARVALYL